MADSIFATAKTNYAKRFQGAYLRKSITLGSPTIRQFYKRMFDQFGRNSYFVSVFGRVLLDEDRAAEAEAGIYEKIQETEAQCSHMVTVMRELVNSGGCEQLAEFHRQQDFEAHIIVPGQAKYLRLLLLGDQYLVLVNTLWLEGLLSDAQKSKAELEIKRQLRAVGTVARNLRLGLQKRIADAQRTDGSGAQSAVETATSRAIESERRNSTDDDVRFIESLDAPDSDYAAISQISDDLTAQPA